MEAIHLRIKKSEQLGSMRYTCMLNMEAINLRIKKLEQLNKMVNLLTYMYFLPLTMKDETDLDKSPLKMCGPMRYTCKSNMKLIG